MFRKFALLLISKVLVIGVYFPTVLAEESRDQKYREFSSDQLESLGYQQRYWNSIRQVVEKALGSVDALDEIGSMYIQNKGKGSILSLFLPLQMVWMTSL